MFFSHTAGSLGIGHVTEGRAVAFVASAIIVAFVAAVGLAWLPVVCEKQHLFTEFLC